MLLSRIRPRELAFAISTQFCRAKGQDSGYFIPEVLTCPQKPLEGSLQHSFSEAMFRDGDTLTVSRVLVREGPIAFPPDLHSLPITISPRFANHQSPRDN